MNVVHIEILEDDDGTLLFTASVNGAPMPIGDTMPGFHFVCAMESVQIDLTLTAYGPQEYQPPV